MKKTFVFALFAFVAAVCCAAETPAKAPDKAPDPNADFKTYASGAKAIYWCQQGGSKEFLPYGKVEIADGKVTITGAGAQKTGIWFFRGHKLPKFQIEPGDIVKISVNASGSGKLFFSVAGYLASTQHYYTYVKGFELSAEPQAITHEFRLNNGCVRIMPAIYVTGADKATISDFKLEVLSAEL